MVKKKRSTQPLKIYAYIVFIVVVGIIMVLIYLRPKQNIETQHIDPAQIISTPTQLPTQIPTPTQSIQQYQDTTPPKVYILSPEENQHIRTPFKIVTNVTDNIKVDHVDFYAGSSRHQYIGTVRQAPYEIMWTPQGFGSNYTTNIPIEAIAYDTAGNSNYAFSDIFIQN